MQNAAKIKGSIQEDIALLFQIEKKEARRTQLLQEISELVEAYNQSFTEKSAVLVQAQQTDTQVQQLLQKRSNLEAQIENKMSQITHLEVQKARSQGKVQELKNKIEQCVESAQDIQLVKSDILEKVKGVPQFDSYFKSQMTEKSE